MMARPLGVSASLGSSQLPPHQSPLPPRPWTFLVDTRQPSLAMPSTLWTRPCSATQRPTWRNDQRQLWAPTWARRRALNLSNQSPIPCHHLTPPTHTHTPQSTLASVGPMAFAYRPSPIGGFGPATPSPTSEQGDQDQRDSLQQQHNNLLSVLFDKNLAHGGAAVLCSLATLSAPVDPLPVSTPPFSSSSWASSLLAANRGTLWVEGARRPPRHPAILLS